MAEEAANATIVFLINLVACVGDLLPWVSIR
jgi:hypothetical protein